MIPPAQHSRRRIDDVEGRLLCLATAGIAAGANSPWPIDADGRAAAVMAIVIVIIVRWFRPRAISLAYHPL